MTVTSGGVAAAAELFLPDGTVITSTPGAVAVAAAGPVAGTVSTGGKAASGEEGNVGTVITVAGGDAAGTGLTTNGTVVTGGRAVGLAARETGVVSAAGGAMTGLMPMVLRMLASCCSR